MVSILKETHLDLPLIKRGKVRDIYEIDGSYLIVTTDRISAFDVVFKEPIPFKGIVLNKLSHFWFSKTEDIIENHIISQEVPEKLSSYKDILEGRVSLVKKADPIPVEAIVRGYLAGSAYKEYRVSGKVCGISLPSGLSLGSKLPEPIFTPSTKEEIGKHDVNITFDEMKERIGEDLSHKIKEISIKIYSKAHDLLLKKGIILADTKFEFGFIDGRLALIDEVLTPDSSRFWKMDDYKKGILVDMDKQFLRDFLEDCGWDKNPPPPDLPDWVIEETSRRYREIYRIVTGRNLI